jgi:hypothetical protein
MPEAPKSCEDCGSPLSAGDRFCSECGRPASETSPQTMPDLPAGEPVKIKKSPARWFILGFAVLLVAGAALYFAGLIPGVSTRNGQPVARKAKPPVVAFWVNFEKVVKSGRPVAVNAGQGITIRIEPLVSSVGLVGIHARLVILDKGLPVMTLPPSFYLDSQRLDAAPAVYWQIGEYTGGAHCCDKFHFWVRPQPGQPVRYLGATAGSEGGPPGRKRPFILRDGQIYFPDADIRFAYFHTSYGGSILFFPCFYRLTTQSLSIDNEKFKDEYLQLAAGVQKEIRTALGSIKTRQNYILDGKLGFFSDNLGQLLIKRTILYLYARQEQKAWQTLDRDVKRYYRYDTGLKNIKHEIKVILGRRPY